jgi:hypothetical protein
MWFKPAIRDSVQPPPGQRMQILQSGFNVHNHHFFRWYREIETAGGPWPKCTTKQRVKMHFHHMPRPAQFEMGERNEPT